MTDPNNNNPLDDLFRKKAGDYNEISFNDADWQKMETKLEARDQLAASRRRQYWLSAAATLIIALLSYYTYQNTTDLNQLNQILNDSLTASTENGTPDSGLSNNLISPGAPDADDPSPLEPESPVEPAAETGQTDTASRQAFAGPGADSRTDEGNTTRVLSDSQTGMTVARITDLPSVSCLECERDLRTVLVPVHVEFPHVGTFATNETTSGEHGDRLLASADRQSNDGRPRFSIGLNVSPELSTAGSLANYTDPGHRLGLTVDYRISDRLSLSTGLMHSTVRYNANRGDYNPPDEYFYGRNSPLSTYAECALLDIPLRLKMDLWSNNRSGFFVTAGLSSYLMLNEEYQFKYENTQPDLGSSWSNRTGTFHLMSNAGFSVGYETNLMPSVSLRAEPYVRLPIREIGWGNVRLYSVGTLFSVNYQFM